MGRPRVIAAGLRRSQAEARNALAAGKGRSRAAGANDLASIELLGPGGRRVKGAIWVGDQQKTGRLELIGSGLVPDNPARATELDRFFVLRPVIAVNVSSPLGAQVIVKAKIAFTRIPTSSSTRNSSPNLQPLLPVLEKVVQSGAGAKKGHRGARTAAEATDRGGDVRLRS
jgi:hypothetical protein